MVIHQPLGRAAALVICVLATPACHPTSPQTITVLHEVTREPLAGVVVSPYYDSPLLQPRFDSAVTDATGRARLDLGWGRGYYLTFRLPSGQERRVWLKTFRGWTFGLWPEPYRRVTLVLPDHYRGLVYVRDSSDSSRRFWPVDEGVREKPPRAELSWDRMVRREASGFVVFDENGASYAMQLEGVHFQNGSALAIERWEGPEVTGVAARPVGYWSGGAHVGSYVFYIGTAAEAATAAKRLYQDAPSQGLASKFKTLTPNRRYFDDGQ